MIDRCNPGGQLVSGERRTDNNKALRGRKEGRKGGRRLIKKMRPDDRFYRQGIGGTSALEMDRPAQPLRSARVAAMTPLRHCRFYSCIFMIFIVVGASWRWLVLSGNQSTLDQPPVSLAARPRCPRLAGNTRLGIPDR